MCSWQGGICFTVLTSTSICVVGYGAYITWRKGNTKLPVASCFSEKNYSSSYFKKNPKTTILEQNNIKASCLSFKSYLFRDVLFERTGGCSPVKNILHIGWLPYINSENRYWGNLHITVLHHPVCDPIYITVLFLAGKFRQLARANSIISLLIFTDCTHLKYLETVRLMTCSFFFLW